MNKLSLPPSVNQAYRLLTSPIRMMPYFIVIGAHRGGTTSLYLYLQQHPLIIPSNTKEVHFFDVNFTKGLGWYKTHFPSLVRKYYIKQTRGEDIVTGEASPYYMFHPLAPKRILNEIPQVKLIAILRNPVDRAYSHYQHSIKRKTETLSFEEAIEKEEERTRGEVDKMLKNENYNSFPHRAHSYLARGIYIDQLKVWSSFFPKEQLLVIKSEDLYTNPSPTFKQVLKFLDLPEWEPKEYKEYNAGSYSKIEPSTRKKLSDYFEPHNQRLYEYLGTNFGW
jgi:hypothetical protein